MKGEKRTRKTFSALLHFQAVKFLEFPHLETNFFLPFAPDHFLLHASSSNPAPPTLPPWP
jgi:hypothetical protein